MSTSLSRAFTTRRSKAPKDIDVYISLPQRSLTTKHSYTPGAVRTAKISAPVELISTTNMLSYNAPDIYPRSRSSSNSSTMSDAHSSRSSAETSSSSVGTPFTSLESYSRENSPTSTSPEPNHLSCYFGTPGKSASDDEAPQIPTRALSHTKKSAEILARKRSISSRMTSPKNSISRISSSTKYSLNLSTARSSVNMFSSNPETTEYPFGSELAQVSELVEEYGASKGKLPVIDEEERELVSKGLFKFRAEDYMSDLQDLITSTFGDLPKPQMSALWI
ncbi:hypothetical protein BJ878DRAFT_17106 [Calycina marina]|uniref:Uncharacterized protein n=1 Tax=Calycina marina TaxID=1763456 RepID=A0A9P7ZB42_9HELO|nr:hypothetical protein BJ878DRAFT_17106 [Calycina marina]